MWMIPRYDNVEPWQSKTVNPETDIAIEGFEEPAKAHNPKLDKKNMDKKH